MSRWIPGALPRTVPDTGGTRVPRPDTGGTPVPRTDTGGTRVPRRRGVAGLAAVSATAFPTFVLAAPSQEDVFKSISDNVGGGDFDATKILYVLGGLIALIVLIAVAGRQRQGNPVAPRAKNHQGKLLKEVMRSIPLRAKELKQLRTIADHADAGKPIASPLTLILCPSVMAKTVQSKRLKLDRRALASVARKAGLQVTRK